MTDRIARAEKDHANIHHSNTLLKVPDAISESADSGSGFHP